MNDIHTIPLFPLGVNIVPDMSLPLHIFEERYKLMISECIAEDKPFGIAFFDGEHLRSVGCMARVVKVIKRYQDGRMDIMTRGGQRFVIQKVFNQKPYMEAFVNFFEDMDDQSPENLQTTLDQLESFLGELSELNASAQDLSSMSQFDLQRLSFAVAALEGFSVNERQIFLEMTSTVERLEKGVQALSKLVQRTRLTREIKGIIDGNGHPPKGLLAGLSSELTDPKA